MIRNTFLKAVALATAVLALGTGCSSESKTVAGPAGKKLTVKSPSDTSIKPGETSAISVDVSRTNFNDPVVLTFAGLPDGVTVMEADRTISKDATTAKLTLKATNEAKPVDDHVVTVTGTGGGMTQEVSFKVTVKQK